MGSALLIEFYTIQTESSLVNVECVLCLQLMIGVFLLYSLLGKTDE